MKLAAPFIQLPLTFDAIRLGAEIEALGESVWKPHPQGFPGNSMLPFVAVNGDPDHEGFQGPMQPTPHLQHCPYLQQVLGSLGVTIGRTRLMRLGGHAEVTRHADQGYYWADRVRIHVPIVTQPTVRFECDGEVVNMAAGECWIFDTWRQHSVQNDAVESRVHLVVDTVGGDEFWYLVSQGRNHQQRAFSGQWNPRLVQPGSEPERNLLFEKVNVPVVMTPWEVTSRIGFLIAEAQPHPNLQPIRQVAAQFTRYWQSLWAAYGEAEAGWPHYRRAIDLFMQQIQQLGSAILLQNQLQFFSSVFTLVGKVALTGDTPSVTEPEKARKPSVVGGPQPVEAQADPQFDRPIFIVSPPRSGSTLLFETLSRSPSLYTIGGESHAVIEQIPELSPARNGIGSNRLTAQQAAPEVIARLRQAFHGGLKDRDGQPSPSARLRMLEKTPKNSLRLPFLNIAFPEGRYVYLHRDACEVMGSMIDAWQSGRFRTYPDLPGWQGLPWSLLLTPDWQALRGKSLAEVVADQWQKATDILLDDLQAFPLERIEVVRYQDLADQPKSTIQRLCSALDLDWDDPLDQALPLSRFTVSAPKPDKWRRHAAELEPLLPGLQATIERAERFVHAVETKAGAKSVAQAAAGGEARAWADRG